MRPATVVNPKVQLKCLIAASGKASTLFLCFHDQLDIAWPDIKTPSSTQSMLNDHFVSIGPIEPVPLSPNITNKKGRNGRR